MKITVINPNTSASMTKTIEQVAQSYAAPSVNIVAVNSKFGPPSIEGFYDAAYSIPGMLCEIKDNPDADAYIIACFDDTGLDAARSLTSAPVIGIGEAAFHAASLLTERFSVITTLERSISTIENNLVKYGLSGRCARVRAAEIPVLALESSQTQTLETMSLQIEQALKQDRAGAIVLGCAGMAHLAQKLSERFQVPVLDGVACAVKFAEALVSLGLKTSKIGGYAQPLTKTYNGQFQAHSPA